MFNRQFANSWYSEAYPNGNYVVTSFLQKILTINNIPVPIGKDLLWTRMSPAGKVAGQDHDGLFNFEYVNNQLIQRNRSFSVNPLIYKGEQLIEVALGDSHQGWRYIDDSGALISGDASFADPSRVIGEYTTHGDITVGQSGFNVVALYNNKRHIINAVGASAIRFNRQGNDLAIAYYNTPSQTAFIHWLNTSELVLLPEHHLGQPPVIPPEKPPIEPPKMPVENAAADLNEFHIQYGIVQNTDEAKTEFCRQFVGWLNGKRGTNRWGQKAREGVNTPSKATIGFWLGSSVPSNPSDGLMDVFQLVSSTGNVSWDTRAENNDPEYHNITGRWFPGNSSSIPNVPGNPGNPPAGSDVELRIKALDDKVNLLETRINSITNSRRVSIKSARGRYLRDDWSDNLGKFDRDSAGDGELYIIEDK